MNNYLLPEDSANDIDLMSVQLSLEESMTTRGAERFMHHVNSSVEHEREEGSVYGKTLLAHRLQQFADAVTKWRTEAAEGRAGNRQICFKRVRDTSSDKLAYLALKNIISGLSTVRTLQYVAVSIGTAIEDEMRLSAIREAERKNYERIVLGAKQRTSNHYKHVYAVRMADRMEDGWKSWTPDERLHVGSKMIDLCVESIGIVEVVTQSEGKKKLIKVLKVREDVLNWITQRKDAIAMLRPMYEPMVVRPRDWTNPLDGGYISTAIKPLKLVKSNNRAYQEELANTDMPLVYSAVNSLQRTAWQVNTKVMEVMRTLWYANSTVAGLPPKDGVPLPVPPADIETNEDARMQYRVSAAKVHRHNLSIRSKRIHFSMILDIADRYSRYRKIYMPYQLDFRGRIYAVSSLNCQGNDTTKSLLRFANGKKLGAEGWKWLAVQGANLMGEDKCSFEDRVNFILNNEEEILAIAADPYNNRGWVSGFGNRMDDKGDSVATDKQWQFLAFCFEWAGFCQYGEDFVSKIPCSADGSCSGIQHFSAMLRCEKGGAQVNLTPSEKPADVYRMVAELVSEQAKLDLVSGTADEMRHTDAGTSYIYEGTKVLAKQWLEFGINRKVTKRSVMTLCYGSKEYGFKEQLLEDILNPARRDGKFYPFSGDGYRAAGYLAKLIWNAVSQVLVKASEAMKWLQETASLAASDQLPVRWTSPCGFPIMQAYANVEPHRVRTAIAGQVIKLTMNVENPDELDRRKQANGISPNFVHAADASHMMLTTVRASQKGITSFAMIHDSFGAPAADMQTMYEVVRESFVEMYESVDVISDFRDEIYAQLSDKLKAQMKPLPERGSLDLQQVRDSRYCFA